MDLDEVNILDSSIKKSEDEVYLNEIPNKN